MTRAAKPCTGCGQHKPLAEFYRDKRAKDGHYSHCRACHLVATNACRRKRRNRLTAAG